MSKNGNTQISDLLDLKCRQELTKFTYPKANNGNSFELPTVRKLHTINLSNGATAFKVTSNIILRRVIRNPSNINFCRNFPICLPKRNKSNNTQHNHPLSNRKQNPFVQFKLPINQPFTQSNYTTP